MRKPARPFTTEYKSRKPAKNAALFDESMVIDELPSRDINADLPEIPDEGRNHTYEQAMKAADSVFGVRQYQSNVNDVAEAPAAPQRTVLSDLTYVDPLQERLNAAALAKRGRKPGSKNKPKGRSMDEISAEVPDQALVEAELPPSIAPVQTRSVVRRRPHVGFIRQLEAKRTAKPGEKWRFKLPRR